MRQKSEKPYTWGDLKKMVNRMPAHLLKLQVYIWPQDEERALVVTDGEALKTANEKVALLESRLKASKEESGEFAEWAFAHYQMSLTKIGDRKPVWHPRFIPLDGKTNIKTKDLFEIFKQQYPK